jgi:hypothetical protein
LGKPYITQHIPESPNPTIGETEAYNTCLDWAIELGMDRIIILHSDDYPVIHYIGEKGFEGTADITFNGCIGMRGSNLVDTVFTATQKLDDSFDPVEGKWVIDYLIYGKPKVFANMSSWVLGRGGMERRFDDSLYRLTESDFIYGAWLDGVSMEYRSLITVVIDNYSLDRSSASGMRVGRETVKSEITRDRQILEERYGIA